MIVDAQLHLWEAESPENPWDEEHRGNLQMDEPFTIEKAVAHMDGAGVERAVLVPPSWTGHRIDYVLQAVERYPGRFAVMGRIPLDKPEEGRARLKAWRETPGLLGVRVTMMGSDRKRFEDGTADWFWTAAEENGIPVMTYIPETKPLFRKIAERHPGLSLIIDHMGISMQIKDEKRIPEAVVATAALSDLPNVSVKVSSTPSYSYEGYPYADMKDHIRRVIDAFGPKRCYWGTDLTRDYTKGTYSQRVTHFTETLDFLSDEDKEWIMGRALVERLNWDVG